MMKLNSITMRIAKGMLAIFMLKLMVFGLLIITQACQKDDLPSKSSSPEANEFILGLNETAENLKQLPLTKSKDKSFEVLRTANTSSTFCIKEEEEEDSSDPPELSTFGDAIEYSNLQVDQSNSLNSDPRNICFSIPDEPTYNNLQSSVKQAKMYLYSQGMTEFEIQAMIREHNGHEIDLIPLVMTLASVETNNSIAVSLPNFFGQSAYAQDWNKVGNCALQAIGADIFFTIDGSSLVKTKWTKKAIRRAFSVVAKRVLGPIGVAIAVVTFTICIAK